jgi:VWFA-related protein
MLPRVIFIAALFLLIFGQPAAAQDPTPTPLPYSESIPYKPRLFRVKPDKKKNDKNAKDAATIAAQPPMPEQMPGRGAAIKEDSPITIPVSVFDMKGNFISDLKKEDFRVFVDGPETAVISVEQRDGPLNVFLVIDTSASSNEVLDSAKKLAVAMAEQFPADDKITVFRFSDKLVQLTPLSTDRSTIAAAVSKLKPGDGGTSIYEVTAELFEKHVSAAAGRTVVIILTDGVDTTSQKTKYSEALVAAERSGATVFPVYLDTFVSSARPRVNGRNIASLPWDVQQVLNSARFSLPGSSVAEYELGRFYLNDLVYLSGGRAVDAKSLLAGKSSVAVSVANEIHKQYYLTFAPVGAAFEGQRKHLKVRVDRPNLAVLTRGSYVVGSPPSKIITK